MPKFNKMYFPVDAIAKHEDFDVWYSDGERALRFEGPWEKESDRIAMIGRMGGQIGQIRPDNKALNYYLRHDRFEYEFQTRVIMEHYYVEGMLWDIHGSVSKPPVDFFQIKKNKNEVHVRKTLFKDHGECFEVTARDTATLRIAVEATVAMCIKEEYKGLSDPDEDERGGKKRGTFGKFFDFIQPKGVPYEKLYDEEGNPLG